MKTKNMKAISEELALVDVAMKKRLTVNGGMR